MLLSKGGVVARWSHARTMLKSGSWQLLGTVPSALGQVFGCPKTKNGSLAMGTVCLTWSGGW